MFYIRKFTPTIEPTPEVSMLREEQVHQHIKTPDATWKDKPNDGINPNTRLAYRKY